MYTVAVVDDDLRQCRILADMIADAPFSSFDILTFQSVPDLESFQAHHGRWTSASWMCAWTTTRDDSPTASRRSRGCFPRARYQVIYVTGLRGIRHAGLRKTPHVYFLLKPVQA